MIKIYIVRMTSKRPSNQDKMKLLLNSYLNEITYDSEYGIDEFEVRFGTKGIKKITKINFDNVLQYLLSKGFHLIAEDKPTLKIRNEFIDANTGETRLSNIRTEITNNLNISDYCKTNSILDENDTIKPSITFLQKTSKRKDGEIIKPVDYDDFNFRVSLQNEKTLTQKNGMIKQMINDWNNTKKIYRLVTRTTLTHKEYPYIRVDLSVVKTSKINNRGRMIPTYSIRESELFENNEIYEIEFEVDKNKRNISYNTNDHDGSRIVYTNDEVLQGVRTTIKYILSGLQQTNYPVSYTEMNDVLQYYMKLIHKKKFEPYQIRPKHFIGPSTISLEVKNIQPMNENNRIPNIRNPYTITDKADGTRKLLVVNEKGKIYLIDTNMNVQFTGLYTKSKKHFNSMLDGEHIVHDKSGDFINLYASFDIYFIQGKDQRTKEFIHSSDTKKKERSLYRLNQLNDFIQSLEPQHIANQGKPLVIQPKTFEISYDETTFFQQCKKMLHTIHSDSYHYETDGLIFTPCNLGVGMDYQDKKPYDFKHTWMHTFKWKPPQYNTIDFLVTTKKDTKGNEIINNIFENGENMVYGNQIKQYKTLILRVGFDERKHGYINPCKDVIEDNIKTADNIDDNNNYRPMPFYPTNPTDDKAYLCNIMLREIGGNKFMFTEDESETFEDNTIVEFKYVKDNKDMWKWVPIRVRYDKTADYRNGLKNYGNAYHVAQSVWSSIHHPVTEHMLSTGLNIPDELSDDDVYYNRTGNDETRALRDFHNLYIKRKLIMGVSKRGDKLIDLAVGKGGDFPKWIASKLRFVFGIDISKDNIENRLDGACARYLNYRRKYKTMPSALFIQGNSSLNIQNGEGIYSEKGKQIMNAIIGKGEKDETKLGKGVYKHYGIGKDGFNIVSTQFALHYFFQNPETLHNFLQNVSENCALNGYFIGTSYDGQQVFRELKEKKTGESISEYKDGHKIWEIIKAYNSDEFKDDSSCIGYGIDVYQETINKVFREYLVNYNYLTRLLDSYGFELISNTEAKKMNLPNGTGMFHELYYNMKEEIKREKSKRKPGKTETEMEIGKANELEKDESQKRISFLNRYFIYKKVRDVNVEEVKKSFLSGSYELEQKEESNVTKEIQETIKEEEKEKMKKPKRKVKKIKRKLILKKKENDS